MPRRKRAAFQDQGNALLLTIPTVLCDLDEKTKLVLEAKFNTKSDEMGSQWPGLLQGDAKIIPSLSLTWLFLILDYQLIFIPRT